MSRSVAAQADGQNDRQLGGQARLNSCSLPMFDAQRPGAASGGIEDHRLDHRPVGCVPNMRVPVLRHLADDGLVRQAYHQGVVVVEVGGLHGSSSRCGAQGNFGRQCASA